MKRCVGFGPLERRCTRDQAFATNGSHRYLSLWCEECEAARRQHLGRRLEELEQHFERRSLP